LTLCLIGAGTALAMVTLIDDFEPGIAVTAALCAIGLYVVGSDSAIRLIRSLNA
jgi:phosphatidylcholine synthase